MGKIKRSRTKLHLTAPKPEASLPEVKNDISLVSSNKTEDKSLNTPSKEGPIKITEVDLAEVGQQHTSKRGRRKQRREKFLAKLNTSYQLKLKQDAAKKRAKTAVVGDMKPLFDALPDIKSLFEESLGNTKSKRGKSNTPGTHKETKAKSTKARMKANLADINIFQRVTKDPNFKADPESAISGHIKSIIQKEQQEQ